MSPWSSATPVPIRPSRSRAASLSAKVPLRFRTSRSCVGSAALCASRTTWKPCREAKSGARAYAANAGRRWIESKPESKSGKANGSTTQAAIYKNGCPGAHQGVRLQEHYGRAEAGQDLHQYWLGRSYPERQADGWRGQRTRTNCRPEAG